MNEFNGMKPCDDSRCLTLVRHDVEFCELHTNARKFSTETRITDPDTGAEKCSKLARFDLIPVEALEELAEHFGRGSAKYADHNWRRGYKWSLSFAALLRHAFAFWKGEDLDAETGSKHIIAVAWHALVLATFMQEQREKDDRWKRA